MLRYNTIIKVQKVPIFKIKLMHFLSHRPIVSEIALQIGN